MKNIRAHKVMVEIPEPKFKRWKYKDENNNRVIIIDFRCIRTTPWQPVDYGARRVYKWNNPEQLKALVDEYFESCFGPIRNPKTGGFYENPDGSLVVGQIKPFTVSGLALYMHVSSDKLRKYDKKTIDSLGFPVDSDYSGPSYSEIVSEALRRIETYAEERTYDRDGFGGGRFVLNCAFNWVERKEAAEIKNLQEQTKLKKKELKFRKKQAAIGDDIIEPINITIRRAGGSDD